MKTRFRFGFAAALLLALPSFAHAQRAGTMAGPPAVAVHSHPVQVQRGPSGTPRATSSHRSGATTRMNTDVFPGDPLSVQQLLDPFPGFGFNFQFLNAIDSDLGIKALIDPVTQGRLAVAERVLRDARFSSPGFFLLDGGVYIPAPETAEVSEPPAPAPQPPQVIVVQAPVAQQPAAREAAPAQESDATPPDEGQFTLVLRNGSEIQATAFTRVNDRIVYITPAGLRRTIPASDLDTEATLRANPDESVPLQLPAAPARDRDSNSPHAD